MVDKDDGPEPTEEPGPLPPGKGPSWRELREEIAEEPGNHGRFAMGCAIAVAIALALFFIVRVVALR